MALFISWYIAITILGWLAFPLAHRLLPGLADRGYSLSRALGLLLWGYFYWLLASLGAAPGLGAQTGGTAGLLFALSIVAALSAWALYDGRSKRRWKATWGWLKHNKRLVIGIELLFLAAFAGWTFVRGMNPEAIGTEKPMELAFINAILKSPTFPPHDPWLSGYAISYYYFGYVLIAMLAKITATPGPLAFNLGISLVFGLSATGAYGLVYNLLEGRAKVRKHKGAGGTQQAAPQFTAPILGTLFVLLVSNLEGFLHSLHTRGLFWKVDASGELASSFWTWLNIKDLNLPPAQPFSWVPTRFWWWWRASRVVQDYDLAGGVKEIIDEFPFFSYLLADLHPHVLAMPFGFLVMALALNLLLGGGRGWLPRLKLELKPGSFLLAALVLGGTAFLNTWDFPVYVALFAGAYTLWQVSQGQNKLGEMSLNFVRIGLALGVAGILLYLPFYVGFGSQAGGFVPNLIFATRGAHLWVMFAPLLIPMVAFLAYLLKEGQNWANFRRVLGRGMAVAGGLTLALWIISLLIGAGAEIYSSIDPEVGGLYHGMLATSGGLDLFEAAIMRRLTSPGGWITLLALMGLILGALLRTAPEADRDQFEEAVEIPRRIAPKLNPADAFAALLALVGALLVLGVEFIYLRDQFGTRMNTIFKFYFQAWLLWGICAAYASARLLSGLKGAYGALFRFSWVILISMSLVYPAFSLWNKTNGFKTEGWTLDSMAYFEKQSPDEMAAIHWLSSAPQGVVAEAVPGAGGSYTQFGRVSMLTGQPAVLGWVGHELQWRGGGELLGSRQDDLRTLFCTREWSIAQAILERYKVRYVYVGSLERSNYEPDQGSCPAGMVEAKFLRHLAPVFQQGSVTIYEVRELKQ